MLHLSLLTLPRSAPRWRYLDSYQLHQVLWKAFPDLPRHTEEGRFLYRHDERDNAHSILVQSSSTPNWRHLENEAEGTITRTKSFDPGRIEAGTRFRFHLRANPVVRRRGYNDRPDGARHIPVGSDRQRMAERLNVPLETLPSREDQLTTWLAKKGDAGGFTLLDWTIGPNRDMLVRRSRKNDEEGITLTSVEFDGVLRVTDATAFERTLRQGIGRGKGFGLGLLSIARVG